MEEILARLPLGNVGSVTVSTTLEADKGYSTQVEDNKCMFSRAL